MCPRNSESTGGVLGLLWLTQRISDFMKPVAIVRQAEDIE